MGSPDLGDPVPPRLLGPVFVFEEAFPSAERRSVRSDGQTDIVNDRRLIPERGFNVKSELKYRPRILDIIEVRNWGLLNRDYNHLDLKDVHSEKSCGIFVRDFYANAYGIEIKTESRVRGRTMD
ncbi:hypothetical protein Syun_019197 [Stephania yunnanensis]|uniref:Uncharacterized protein n=1 Tax=Stephania yunnanensis TaxID=152371 RepID=A0AAP0IUD0_9MAGN